MCVIEESETPKSSSRQKLLSIGGGRPNSIGTESDLE
ncbi:unnamed protein product [Arabidopsis lyrata]|nr:unnamed protein product [Arabidopsis lyrata]